MRGKVLPQEDDVFAGRDVDKRSLAVSFANPQSVIRSLRMPYSVEHLVQHVRKHFGKQKVLFAYEAGPTGYGLYDGLVAEAYPCILAAPARIPRAPGQRVKTNRLDSVGLAEQLRGGQLRSIHGPSPVYRELRHLTQLRDTAVSDLVATKQRIKSLLLREGLPFPPAPAGSQWSARGVAALRTLSCAGAVRFKLDQLLASLACAATQVRQSTRAIRRFCRSEPELSRNIQYLRTVPGVGWIVASQLLARLGDWRELPHGRRVASFLGVVPSERSTGEHVARGAITRSGDGRLRSKRIQAAWAAIRQDAELREFYRQVARRQPRARAPRVAIVAVARKLSGRIAVVLRQQRPYTVRATVKSAPLTKLETTPQGTPRRRAEPGATADSPRFGP